MKSAHGAKCGAATYSPADGRVAFILGPERPTADWQYAANHRRGVLVWDDRPGMAVNLDARDLVPPYTPVALRGGSHVHVFSGDGQWVSFTYQDHPLAQFADETPEHECDLRNIGVSAPFGPVTVTSASPQSRWRVLLGSSRGPPRSPARLRRHPTGVRRRLGRHRRLLAARRLAAAPALAFQGQVVGLPLPFGGRHEMVGAGGEGRGTREGRVITEVFLVDLPDDITIAGDGRLEGTATHRPRPPRGTVQRRLTFTANRRHPGLQGPRHWLRSSPDGAKIAFLMAR